MCGICGVFHYQKNNRVDRAELQRMNDSMRSRGPDGEGIWINSDNALGFAHRRLSIIDLSSDAAQPMHDGDFTITYNGEIYNYKNLRDDLLTQGVQFKTHSDTEVILKLYQLHGTAMLRKLRGMFAFAIWDNKKKILFCARDHFGIKPFYFSDNGNSIRFASRVKTLLTVNQINTEQSAAGTVGFYLLGSVPEPYTLYKGIESLPAGHYLIAEENKKPIIQSFYSIKSAFIEAENNPVKDFSLTEQLYDTVKHHLIADVDVGVFLSAGIDSATLANVASELTKKKLHTVTLGFSEYKNTEKDETVLASEIAKLFQTDHQNKWIDESFAKNHFQNIKEAMDQPSIDGINTYFVSLIAHQTGLKVALSGLGADELLAGYPLFSRIPALLKYSKPISWLPCLPTYFRRLSSRQLTPKQASILEYSGDMAHAYFISRATMLPWELETVLDADIIREGMRELNLFERLKNDCAGIRSARFQISALEMQWYMRNQLLRDSDWASMASSLELRVPFVDVVFFENCIRALAYQSFGKKELARAPHRQLPEKIINRKKTGFNIPVTKWFSHNQNMKTFLGEVLGW